MEPDFCENDENLSKFITEDGTDSIDIASPRNNSDCAPVDKNIRCLSNLCISSGLRILNGRVFCDCLGYHTCFSHNGNPSTIYYFLASSCLLGNMKYLQMIDPNVNSVHCFLRLSLSTNFSLNLLNGDKYNGMHSAINYKWNDSIALTFERAVKCNKRSLDCKSFSSKNPENRVNRFGHLIEWFLAATKQLYKWYFPSVCPSVCLSVPLSVTPFWLCSHHHIIMKFSGAITNDHSKVHANGQGQRSKVKVTEVTTQLNRFRTVTPVWIHIWWWNDAYSLMLLRRGALLFFKVIRLISRSHGSKNRRIWPRLGVSGL